MKMMKEIKDSNFFKKLVNIYNKPINFRIFTKNERKFTPKEIQKMEIDGINITKPGLFDNYFGLVLYVRYKKKNIILILDDEKFEEFLYTYLVVL